VVRDERDTWRAAACGHHAAGPVSAGQAPGAWGPAAPLAERARDVAIDDHARLPCVEVPARDEWQRARRRVARLRRALPDPGAAAPVDAAVNASIQRGRPSVSSRRCNARGW